MSEHLYEQVNQHYLNRVLSLSDQKPIIASEDIFSSNGTKLLAKGSPITRAAQERLILHKLRRPLEVSLRISDSITVDWLAQAADRTIEELPELRPLFGITDLTRWVDAIPLNGTTHGLISVIANQETCGLQHHLRVALVALAIGYRLRLDESAMQTLAIAGLMHDIGELYIAPEFVQRLTPISLDGWRHISAHPLIGFKIASDLCGFHPDASRAILEHHERGDGSGYPKGLDHTELSRIGQILSAAELVASIADSASHPLIRADLALRLMPGEFPFEVYSAINQSLPLDKEGSLPVSGQSDAEMHELLLRIARVMDLLETFHQDMQHQQEESQLLIRVKERFLHIQRAFSSSGLDICKTPPHFQSLMSNAPEWLRFEADLIIHETRWRMRDLARDLALRANLLSPASASLFLPLVHCLLGENSEQTPHRHLH